MDSIHCFYTRGILSESSCSQLNFDIIFTKVRANFIYLELEGRWDTLNLLSPQVTPWQSFFKSANSFFSRHIFQLLSFHDDVAACFTTYYCFTADTTVLNCRQRTVISIRSTRQFCFEIKIDSCFRKIRGISYRIVKCIQDCPQIGFNSMQHTIGLSIYSHSQRSKGSTA